MSNAHDDDFDGITEEDNPMPAWWLWTFLVTIPFAFIYFIHFHMVDNTGLMAEYRADKAKLDAAIAAHGPKLGELAEKVMASLADEAKLLSGSNVFQAQCAVCHGQQGEGIIGPNLTDMHSIHGVEPEKILTVLNEGVLAKGMPAWGQVLSPDELLNVAIYVKSLQGKMVSGKPPEGEEFSN